MATNLTVCHYLRLTGSLATEKNKLALRSLKKVDMTR